MKLSSILKFLTAFSALMVMTGAADFYRWVNQVAALETPVNPKADAIAVLTGGAGRIETSLKLLETGAGKRLLVSGVHASVHVRELRNTSGGSQVLYDCCIDFGREAHSTEGNALETIKWSKAHEFNSLILVTSNYHMPRAMMWFRNSFAKDALTPYPMDSGIRPEKWWTNWRSFRGLTTEWIKYRITAVLIAFQ